MFGYMFDLLLTRHKFLNPWLDTYRKQYLTYCSYNIQWALGNGLSL